jgi:hypothetical protein
MNRGKATISELRSDQSLLGARVALREALCACALQIISIFFEALRAALARIASFFTNKN